MLTQGKQVYVYAFRRLMRASVSRTARSMFSALSGCLSLVPTHNKMTKQDSVALNANPPSAFAIVGLLLAAVKS